MPRYSDETLKDIYKNATETLEWQGDRMQFEDALQCIILLVDDLREARKRIKELENERRHPG